MVQACTAQVNASVLFFSNGEAQVSVNQAQADVAERATYNSAYNQCWTHLMCHPPRQFDVKPCGSAAAPQTDVAINSSLLAQLPLLLDVSQSTEQPKPDKKRTFMRLPCSVWGLVSLLVLLEGGVTIDSWFRRDRDARDLDASLPAQTMKA